MSSKELPRSMRAPLPMRSSNSGAAELMVEPGLHHADELADATSAARAQPVLGHDHAGEPGDQGAVEIEEGTDLGPRWAAPRSRRPSRAAAWCVGLG